MMQKLKRDFADKWFLKPDGIEARLAHARRYLTRRRRDKAEQTFQRSLHNYL